MFFVTACHSQFVYESIHAAYSVSIDRLKRHTNILSLPITKLLVSAGATS